MQKTALKLSAMGATAIIAAICAVLSFLTFGAEEYTDKSALTLFCVLGFAAVTIFAFKDRTAKKITQNIALFVFGFVFVFGAFVFLTSNLRCGVFIVFYAVIIACALLCKFANDNALSVDKIAVIIFIVAFAVRLSYVLYTGVIERQHDVETFGSGFGHAGYIEWFYDNFKLPDFDVCDVWQFYHPPLHHIISAAFLRALTFVGVAYDRATETLQMLTLFYSSVTTVAGYKILKEFKLGKKAFVCAFSVMAFHPSFTILSASVNNDILSVMFQMLALLFTLRWYKNRTYKNIIKIAFSVGFGMFAKLSAWMITPAVAFVFLYAFVKSEKTKKAECIKQFFVFGLICVPIGMFWSVRNAILFNVPFTYIPNLGTDVAQYIGFRGAFERLFDFGVSHFKNVFESWGNPFFEYNPTVALLKTAVFGEWQIKYGFFAECVANVLFYSSVLLALLGIASAVLNLKRKDVFSVFFFSIIFVISVMFYVFCFKYPFTCTQDARYVIPVIPVLCAETAIFSDKKSKAFKVCPIVFCTVFSVSSVIMYI